MDKPIIYYEARPQVNRATGATIMVPAIVEREQSVPLEEIVRRAIDRGLIAGVKETYAHQIGEAIAQQMYDELRRPQPEHASSPSSGSRWSNRLTG